MSSSENPIYRFSEAPIWELQRAYFEEEGIKAWQKDEVPQYITSNPVIGTAYAEIIFSLLQDRAQLGETTEPVTILELGAGSGRLAFHVLKALTALVDTAGMLLPSFRYVMSDLPHKNIAYWQQHESLRPFTEQGLLDFAVFDAERDTELNLTHAGITVRQGDLKQPLLIIANYFFDSIPQQLIYVDESKIYECRVSYELPTETDALSASDMLEQMVPEYHYFRAAEYEQPLYPYRDVIELYQQRLEDSHILFPVIGLSCLERLEQLSTVGFLLLTADKGDHRLENWEFAEPPKLIHHGSFSLTANYHAIQHTFESKGALSYFTKHHYKNLNVGCILMLQNPSSYAHTRLAYRRFVERFGPDDFFSLKLWFDEHLGMLNFTQIISFWRLSQYDSQLFLQCVDRLLQLLPDASEEEANDLDYGISMMWSSYYPMNEPHHLAQSCANLLFQLELYESARHYFEQSLKTYEANGELLYDLAICCYEMEDEAAALDYAQQALATEPGHEEAKALIASIV